MTERLGFVGTGTITEAVINGLMASPAHDAQILVSPRGREIAERLAAAHPDVRVAADNQAVVDGADTVFLAVRPQIAEEVIRALRFRPGQLVVSFIATLTPETLAEWIDCDVKIVRAIPLPFVAERTGVTAIHPPHPWVRAFFDQLGSAVECTSAEEYDTILVASALMGTYFGVLETATGWLASKGVSNANARNYLAPLFASLAQRAVDAADTPLAELRAEFSTKGGLNEQVFNDFDSNGGSRGLIEALNRVHDRIKGR